MDDLSLAARGMMTAVAIATVLAARRALFRTPSAMERPVSRVLYGILAVALVFTYVPALLSPLLVVFPLGLAFGLGLAVASLFVAPVRAIFDQLADGDVRLLVGARAGLGALLIALAALGAIPKAFAMTAGVGDIVVGALAIGVPGPLDRTGPRLWRGLVHVVGFADLVMVVYLAITVVRPFLLARGEAPITMALPWLVVPLMVAIDLHGIRKALDGKPESRRDGSESAGGVRRAVPGA